MKYFICIVFLLMVFSGCSLHEVSESNTGLLSFDETTREEGFDLSEKSEEIEELENIFRDVDLDEISIPTYFIELDDSNTYKLDEKNQITVTGTTSNNCQKIVVTMENESREEPDVYTLTTYELGDTSFTYRMQEKYNNLFVGTNTYKFEATCGPKIVSTGFSIDIYEKQQPIIPKTSSVVSPDNSPRNSNVNCAYDSYDCENFSSCYQAREVFNTCRYDVHDLDRDHDGIPCEVLCD